MTPTSLLHGSVVENSCKFVSILEYVFSWVYVAYSCTYFAPGDCYVVREDGHNSVASHDVVTIYGSKYIPKPVKHL